MGQSLSQMYIHLTFSTKFRKPFISTKWEDSLHSYMAGILKRYQSPALIINSVPDHVHILFRLSKNYALSKILEELKKESSKWIKKTDTNLHKFSWQIGYAAFSVSGRAVNKVTSYINNQKSHHNVASYKDEVEELINEYDIVEYDAEYFWE
ncbi:MAG: IS200/IS605 family transposase [Bacteroidales bacterium]|nr:IS200/IS605 family transposase [Bacteroidales bacterium]